MSGVLGIRSTEDFLPMRYDIDAELEEVCLCRSSIPGGACGGKENGGRSGDSERQAERGVRDQKASGV